MWASPPHVLTAGVPASAAGEAERDSPAHRISNAAVQVRETDFYF